MKKNLILLFIVAVSVALVYNGIKVFNQNKPLRTLPILGKTKATKNDRGETDTLYHTIQNFSFIDQKGNTITQEIVKNKIYVADYFFCTCQSICPVMTKQMGRVAGFFAEDNEVLFLSHTVNPEHDSVNVLADYAIANGVKYGKWYLLTGSKPDLYKLARESYLLDASEGNGGTEDFIHTEFFALIDKERRIRGFYDGTDSLKINELIKDIQLLKKEYQTTE